MNNTITDRDISRIFSETTGMITIPAVENRGEYIEIIWEMLRAYGYEETLKRMKSAFNAWISQKARDGRPYSRLNLSWINFAMAGETPGKVELTRDERIAQELDALKERAKQYE